MTELLKSLFKIKGKFWQAYFGLIVRLSFIIYKVNYKTDFITRGKPFVRVYNKTGSFTIGKKFKMNNGFWGNIIGRQQKCIFFVKGHLVIKDNVGISSVAVVCHNSITIGNNVLIGGNTVIYDTDFHSMDYLERTGTPEILSNVKTAPVFIDDNAFIGAHSIILKGVTIGKNSIIGAGSLVSKSIPPNEIWAGNPAKKIKDILVT